MDGWFPSFGKSGTSETEQLRIEVERLKDALVNFRQEYDGRLSQLGSQLMAKLEELLHSFENNTTNVIDRIEAKVTGSNNVCRSLEARVSDLTSQLATSADLHARLNDRIEQQQAGLKQQQAELQQQQAGLKQHRAEFQELIDILRQDKSDIEERLRVLSERSAPRAPASERLPAGPFPDPFASGRGGDFVPYGP